jgi:hypothetical protein
MWDNNTKSKMRLIFVKQNSCKKKKFTSSRSNPVLKPTNFKSDNINKTDFSLIIDLNEKIITVYMWL